MRILTVGNMYPPHHLGGYELVWASAVAHLREHGHDVRVLSTVFRTSASEPDPPEVYRELGWYWRDHEWPRLDRRTRVRLERHNRAVLRRHLDDLQPEVVSWWAMGGMSLALIEQVRRAEIPAVAFVHDEWLVYAPRVDQWIRMFAGRRALAAVAERIAGVPTRVDIDAAARCLLVSEIVRAHARAEGYSLRDSAIAPSGIDASLFEAAPERPWAWRLLYVGRIDERKGVGDAVAALADLPSQATLTLVGTGDRRELRRLDEVASGLRIGDRAHRVGMRPRRQLPETYAAADVLLFPVRWDEPWGLVPLEAMAVGRPVIATGRGGSGEYLRDGINCLIVPAGAPGAIAQAVTRLASEPELRARLRHGGLATALRYTEVGFNQEVLAAVTAARRGRAASIGPAHET